MEHVQVQIQNKLKLLFSNILAPNYVMNNYYVDGLIDKLSNSEDPEIAFLEKVPLISDLVFEALKYINNKGANHTTHITVKVFVHRILAIAAQKELHFSKLFKCLAQGHIFAEGFKDINSPSMNPSLRVAYMEIALAILKHSSGILWLLETGVWRHILDLCHQKQTIFVVRQTYKFSTTFLWKLNDMQDETNIRSVIDHIMKPIYAADFASGRSLSAEEEEVTSQQILPIMRMFLALITEDGRIENPSLLLNILIKEYSISSHLCLVFDRIRSDEVTLLAAKLLIYFSLAKIFLTKPLSEHQEYAKDDFLEMTVMYFNTIQRYIQRRQPIPILDFCNSTISVWSSVWKKRWPDCGSWNKIDPTLQLQLLFICLVPSLVYVKMGDGAIPLRCEVSDERVTELIMKFLNSNCEHTSRAAYAVRDLTLELDTVNITLQSVKRISCLKNHLTNKQANLVFQTLFYILTKYDPLDENSEMKVEANFEVSQDKVLVMTHVLEIVHSLVKNHDINWTESLEIIALYNVVYKILKRPNLSCKFIVTALNVIRVIVKKFLTPNMSLLLESKPGSDIHELGKLIYLRLHDMHWEVRDSALELLLVCTEMAFIKFPPFQSQISDNRLINVAAAIAFSDEYYVQASALRCLGAATKISKLWNQLLEENPDIMERLIVVLRDNAEGIVRKEACNVLLEVYQNVKLSNEFKKRLYEQMVTAAIGDFYWEVQLCALKFWRNVIHGLLSDQGMLDGTFPPVTFSRETRKIVNLNDAEIQRRLLKILDDLASIGCLTVLVTLLNEETEADILDLALTISNEFNNILTKYKLHDVIKPIDNDVQSVDELLCHVKDEDNTQSRDMDIVDDKSFNSSDNVIEGIINVDDLNLLASIYQDQLNLQQPAAEISKGKIFKCASPYLFVNHLTSKDFKSIVAQKKQWKEGIRSVSSLLDDVLGIYEINDDANALDCY